MNDDVRLLFRELAGQTTTYRLDHYSQRQVPVAVRAELEALITFDETRGSSFTGLVGAATEQFLLSGAPVPSDGRCGPYRLIQPIGNGGMGAVFLAERADGEIQQQVAIKFLQPQTDLPAFRLRFLRERQILASMNHPGIARLLDVGHCRAHPYLVMEYVKGIRLDQFASGLDQRAILTLWIKVAEAVSYAHRNLIIHRDLKPTNILVDEAGNPKLLDFGIAKLLDVPEETRTIEAALTPEYASPEQFRGDARTTATDIYSLGAVLYRLLTSRSPRTADGSELPKDLASILAKSMRSEPDARYASVDLFVADVRAYLQHRPVQARKGNALYLTRKFVRRRWLPVAAAALAVMGVAGGFLIADRERATAQRRFQQVRQLSKQFLDLDAEIRNLPGSPRARKRIVTASLEYLERLGAETGRSGWRVPAGQDLELALEIGSAYLQVARVQGVPTNTNLGMFAEAGTSLSKADSLVESVLAVPTFPLRRKALLTGADIAQDGMILAHSENRTMDSLALGRKAASRLEAMLAMPGLTREETANAGRIFANLALTHSNLHYLEESARYARRSVDIARGSGNDYLLAKTLSVYANPARFAGDLDGALAAIREARAIGEKLIDFHDTDKVLLLCGALWREGLILGELNNINLDRPAEAVPLLQRAFDMAEALARQDAQDYASRSYVSMTGRELGDVLRDGDPARALAIYDRTRRWVAEIRNPKSRRDEVWLLTGSSYALRRLGRPAESLQRVQAALTILGELKDYPGATVAVGDEADVALRALADHLADTGRLAEAIRTYEDLHEKLQASKPQPNTDLRHANALSRLYRSLANLHLRAGRRAEANVLQQQRMELWQYWDFKLPGNSFVRRQISGGRV